MANKASDAPGAGPVPGFGAIVGRAKPTSERVIEWFLFACGAISILTTAGILAVLAVETVRFFAEVSPGRFFLDTEWTPLFTDAHFGIWPLVAGTMLTTGIAVLVAVPLGLLAAIYLSEFASARVRRTVKPALELLAGIPTIVYGYFALLFVTPLLQKFVPGLAGFNALSPGIVMGIMIMPMVSSLSEDALFAVPRSLREGGYALGSGKLPTIFRVVLPAALSGVAASVILALSRAVGETMIVTVAAGQQARLTADPRVAIETMTAFIVQITMGDTPTGTTAHRTIFAVGSTLFAITFVFNLAAQRLARRYRDRL